MVWDRVSGPRDKRLAWVRADHSKNKKVKARQTLTLFTINCDTSGYRTLSVVDYDKEGKLLEQWGEKTFGEDYSYAPPGSNIEHVVQGACLSRFGQTPIPPPASVNGPISKP